MSSPLFFAAQYDAPQDAVWSVLQQPEVWQALTGVDEVTGVEMNGDQLAAIQWRSKIGPRNVTGETRIEASSPPDLMTMVVDGGDVIALTTATLTDLGGSTGIEVVGNLEAKGFMAHLILPVVSESIRHSMPAALARLRDFL